MHLVDFGIISGTNVRIVNQGTLLRTGSGTFELTAELANEGSMALEGGQLRLNEIGSSTNSVEVQPDATLQFLRSFTFSPSTSLTGEGRIVFSGGTHDYTAAQLLPQGKITFSGGTITIGNSLPESAQIEQIRTRVTFNADQVLNSVDASFGNIQGSGNLTFTGVSSLNQSALSGTGTVEVVADAPLDVFSLGATVNRRLDNHGKVRVFGGLSGAGTVINHQDALFQSFPGFQQTLSVHRFENQGVFEKHNDGVSLFETSGGFENAGIVSVLQGRVLLGSGASTWIDANGIIDVAAGGELQFFGQLTLLSVAVLTGTGLVDGDVLSSGTVRPGSELGRLRIEGNYTQTPDGRLELQIGGLVSETEYDELTVTGSAVMQGSLVLQLVDGFTPNLGDSFTLAEFASTDGQFSAEILPAIAPLEFTTSRTGQS